MAWVKIEVDDSKGVADFLVLMAPIHEKYAAMDEAAVGKIVSTNQDCEIWLEREAEMAMILRNHQPTQKGHVLMMAMPEGMENDVGLKYVCQVFSLYSERHGGKDILAIVPKSGCLPRMASFYNHAVTSIPGSSVISESDRATHCALPKSGTDQIKDAIVERKIK